MLNTSVHRCLHACASGRYMETFLMHKLQEYISYKSRTFQSNATIATGNNKLLRSGLLNTYWTIFSGRLAVEAVLILNSHPPFICDLIPFMYASENLIGLKKSLRILECIVSHNQAANF